MKQTLTLYDQAVECAKRECCDGCPGEYYPEEGVADCNHYETCEEFKKHIEQTLKEWATEDAAREPEALKKEK